MCNPCRNDRPYRRLVVSPASAASRPIAVGPDAQCWSTESRSHMGRLSSHLPAASVCAVISPLQRDAPWTQAVAVPKQPPIRGDGRRTTRAPMPPLWPLRMISAPDWPPLLDGAAFLLLLCCAFHAMATAACCGALGLRLIPASFSSFNTAHEINFKTTFVLCAKCEVAGVRTELNE